MWGSRFRVWILGCGVQRFRVCGLKVDYSGFGHWAVGFGLYGAGLSLQGSSFKNLKLCFRVLV